MQPSKRKLFRLLFAGEIIIFGILYFFGPYGVYYLQHTSAEYRELKKEITTLQQEIKELENNIYLIKTDSFYKEKIAREQLQMARKEDVIYLVDQCDSTY